MSIGPEIPRERPFGTFTQKWLKACQEATERIVNENPPKKGLLSEETWGAIEVNMAIRREIELREIEKELRELNPEGIVT